MSLLDVSNLEKSFGGVDALAGVDLTVEEGEIVGLIGPNGAGKTTLFNCMTGLIEPDKGTVVFDGEDVTGASSDELANRGLVRTFQRTKELTTMTVTENVRLASPDHPGERAINALMRPEMVSSHESDVGEHAAEQIEFFDLDHLAHEFAGSLSGGQRKLLELARVLMLEPDLLLLDEVFAGVNPTLTNEVMDHIRSLNDDGMTLLVIEHEIQSLSDLVDRIIVLNQGSVLANGRPGAVLNDETVIDAYLGGEL